MDTQASYAIWAVALLHIVFCVAEVFFWETLTPPLKVFNVARARETSVVGHNGILAACLIWLLSATGLDAGTIRSLGTLLLSCIIVAGIFGGFAIKWTIPLFQSLPALIALVLLRR
jgi:putative membrane protein